MKATEQGAGFVGRRVRRLEDPGLVTGADLFTGDIYRRDALHVAFVRSTNAHAKISSIDVSEAVASPGVVGVYLAADLALAEISIPDLAAALPAGVGRPAIAHERVRFVGEIVAVVVGESIEIVTDSAELVYVDYEPLPVVVGIEAAATPEATLLFDHLDTNVAFDCTFTGGTRPESTDVSVTTKIKNNRVAVAPMEGNAILVIPDVETGKAHMYASSQMPHSMQFLTASFVGMDPADLRVTFPAVGGGFGGKSPTEAEYAIVLAVARKLGRPVRWVQSRMENLATMQARAHLSEVTLEATNDGKLTALKIDALSDFGAYPGIGLALMTNMRNLATGPYNIPYAEYRDRGVATNTAPICSLRGAGRPEATAMLERSMDILAAELDIDPIELRRRNFLTPNMFPYVALLGSTYDSGDYEKSLDAAVERSDYHGLRAQQAERRRTLDRMQIGIGISAYVEVGAAEGMHREYGSIEVQEDGRVRAVVGTSAHGQGHRTTFTQIVSDAMSIPMELIDFVQSDTALVPWGFGTGTSRSVQIGGNAMKASADAVVEKARQLAAHLFEAEPDDIVLTESSGFSVKGVPSSALSWADLAVAATQPDKLPAGMTPRLFEDPGFEQSTSGTAPFGCHIAIVEVDIETGMVNLTRYVAVDDCGNVINPMIAEGQVHGGVATGIGQALYEEVLYDDLGNQLTSTFAEYLMPSAAEFPSFETSHTVTPSLINPLGAKGLGEGGATASTAAVHNAVVDAVRPLGVRHIQLPLSPMNVWSAIADARMEPSRTRDAATQGAK
ncbi:MAG: xanthine dehydrogenase family protein molybdopterin-binding subunit [Pseudonocardia sp.]|nr:MAG: xanthine dehydrogenase family protein molybdopterin-binding subunit [Pseudonocardia sp.]